MTEALPFRQIHLDFHTSEHIPSIGHAFDPDAFASTLKESGVDSVVLFSKCHHGWSYYDTSCGEMHPGLDFDLLRKQFDACKAAGLKVPIYLSVGWDERLARMNPGWRQILPDGGFFCLLGNNLDAAWSYMCLNSPYLEAVCTQIEEITKIFPDADGLWLDIIKQEQCCCNYCRASMTKKGLDFQKEADRLAHSKTVLDYYYERATAAARKHAPEMGVFHNTSMVPRGDRSLFDAFSHIEIEAVPTGGWGYDHLPMSAKYLGAIGKNPMGVTVRFHVVWGELGGYKPLQALRYETMSMLSHGCRVCIGDQLDPSGTLDGSSYKMIAEVFGELEQKEIFGVGSKNVADIAILSSIAVNEPGAITRAARHNIEDEGALKILQESHFLFDVVDQHSEFSPYKLLVLPDRVRLSDELAAKLKTYVENGGKLLLTGESGLKLDGSGFALPLNACIEGMQEFNPTYLRPRHDLAPPQISDPFSVMTPGLKVKAINGAESLGDVFEPFFNRTPHHFNGHIHAPPRPEPSGNSCGVKDGSIVYLPHFLFSLYRQLGPHTVKSFVAATINDLLGEERTLRVSQFASGGVVTLRHQANERRYLVHVLYGDPRLRGETPLGPLEAIDNVPRLAPLDIKARLPQLIATATTWDDHPIEFRRTDTGETCFSSRPFRGHDLYILEY